MLNSRLLRDLAGPAFVLAILTFVAFIARPLTPIDETRYVSVAWEMWVKSEYLVLFKNGETYSHKPPLLFWIYNLGWAVFGVNEVWPRLVSPLFSLGSMLLTYSIAARLWPNSLETRRHALWVLCASLLWLLFSTLAMFDVMLAFFVLLGIRGLLIAANESPGRGFFWFGVAIGFGVLAKGPVVLLHLLPMAVLAPWWHPGLRWAGWYPKVFLALLGGAVIALAWAIPAALHGGEEYRNAILWGQTANRMVNSFAHQRPFWWYLVLLPVLLFPWSFLPKVWGKLIRVSSLRSDPGLLFCAAWMIPVFIAFSFVSGKQVHYLMPLFPAFALFVGRLAALEKAGGALLPALATLVAAASMIYFSLAELPSRIRLWAELPLWPGAVLLAMAIGALWLGRFVRWRVPALAVMGAGFVATFQLYLSSVAMHGYDVRPMAQAIKQLQDRGTAIAHLGGYHAQYQFLGRLEHPLDELQDNELFKWLESHPEGAVVAYVRQRGSQSERRPEPEVFLFSQPHRGQTVFLMSASQAKAQLGVLLGPAAGDSVTSED